MCPALWMGNPVHRILRMGGVIHDKDGNKVYNADGTCNNSSKYWKNNIFQGDDDLLVTAYYRENVSYIVNYDKNSTDATGTMSSTNIYAERGGTLSNCNFKRDGYRFTGWNTKADGSGDSYIDAEIMDTTYSEIELDADGNEILVPKSSVTLYAQWKSVVPARYDEQTIKIPNAPTELPKSNKMMIGVKKVDEESGKPISGAEFTLIDDITNLSYKGTSDEDGIVSFSGITELNSRDESSYTYTLKETKYPDNYKPSDLSKMPYKISVTREKDDDDYTLQVTVTDGDGKNVKLVPENDGASDVPKVYIIAKNKSLLKTLKLIKTDETTTEKLSRVVFTLYGTDSSYRKRAKTNANGVVMFTELKNGTYRLHEYPPEMGYAGLEKNYLVTVSDSGITIKPE